MNSYPIFEIKSVSEWEIIGIGKEHCVFGISSSKFSIYNNMALRIRLNNQINICKDRLHFYESLFSRYVTRKYSLDQYFDVMPCVRISQKIWKILSEKVFRYTSGSQSLSDDSEYFGLICRNYKTMMSNSYEIKPKWSGTNSNGVIPCPCKYCSHPKRKHDKSLYCPTSLFSGHPELLKSALINYPFLQKTSDKQLNILSIILTKDPFLVKLNAAHLHSVYSLSNLKVSDYGSEREYLQNLYLASLECSNNIVIDFMSSFSIRDCSVFIMFDEIKEEVNENVIEIEGSRYEYQIRIIDIDIKSMNRIEKYKKEIENFYFGIP